jgi:ABC-type multidrug transport system fused ATPase/permease subunit
MKGILDFVKVSNNIDSLEKLEIEKGKVQIMIMKMAAITLGSIMLSVVIMMLIGLFLPNAMIDNNEIFKIIGPAFSMIVGAFVGAFATMMNMKVSEFDPNVKVQEMGKTDYKHLAEAHTEHAKAESIEADTEIKLMAAVDKYKDSDDDFGPF